MSFQQFVHLSETLANVNQPQGYGKFHAKLLEHIQTTLLMLLCESWVDLILDGWHINHGG